MPRKPFLYPSFDLNYTSLSPVGCDLSLLWQLCKGKGGLEIIIIEHTLQYAAALSLLGLLTSSYCSLLTLRMLLLPLLFYLNMCARILILREREAFLFFKFVASPCVLNRVYEYIWNRRLSWRIVGSLLKIILELNCFLGLELKTEMFWFPSFYELP